jgi:phosphate/sulfate permease
MSSETWQEIMGLLALSPWIAFVVAIAWFWVLELRDNARAAQAGERARPSRSEKRVERRPSTNA